MTCVALCKNQCPGNAIDKRTGVTALDFIAIARVSMENGFVCISEHSVIRNLNLNLELVRRHLSRACVRACAPRAPRNYRPCALAARAFKNKIKLKQRHFVHVCVRASIYLQASSYVNITNDQVRFGISCGLRNVLIRPPSQRSAQATYFLPTVCSRLNCFSDIVT